ncbi:MAG: hypothetical protein R2882_03680 [Gemmatimonadales bacterium]
MRPVAAIGAILVLGTGCAKAGTAPVPYLSGAWNHYLITNAVGPTTAPAAACEADAVDLGPLVRANIRRLQLRLNLPASFGAAPRNPPQDRFPSPVGDYWLGTPWLDGLGLVSAWYRWTRLDDLAAAGPDASTTLIQLVQERGYQMLAALPPWRLAGGAECWVPIGRQKARVFRFELAHPTLPRQWGLMAFWRGRPNDGWVSFLGLGPRPSTQAEMLAILAALEP